MWHFMNLTAFTTSFTLTCVNFTGFGLLERKLIMSKLHLLMKIMWWWLKAPEPLQTLKSSDLRKIHSAGRVSVLQYLYSNIHDCWNVFLTGVFELNIRDSDAVKLTGNVSFSLTCQSESPAAPSHLICSRLLLKSAHLLSVEFCWRHSVSRSDGEITGDYRSSFILNFCSRSSVQTSVPCDSEEKQLPLTALFSSQPIRALPQCWQPSGPPHTHKHTQLSFPTADDDLEETIQHTEMETEQHPVFPSQNFSHPATRSKLRNSNWASVKKRLRFSINTQNVYCMTNI